jgi:hypothetical protein
VGCATTNEKRGSRNKYKMLRTLNTVAAKPDARPPSRAAARTAAIKVIYGA